MGGPGRAAVVIGLVVVVADLVVVSVGQLAGWGHKSCLGSVAARRSLRAGRQSRLLAR